ncbi:MAG TPA: aspartate kinase [Bacillales bacterium]|nr:aspartate kinase [Bacillales bacterium]
MALIVQKFGGTSVGTVERIQKAAKRIIGTVEKGNRVVVTVSAMGKTTDELMGLATQIHSRPSKRETDMLLTAGEQISMSLLAMALESHGFSAVSLTGWQAGIQTEEVHGNARILKIETERIQALLDESKIVIVAGFQGISEKGEITTLGRGGSDTTAVALAAALKAQKCEIYTDVDGVYTCDPRFVKEASKIEAISYDEMLELATLGAGVLHPRAVEFAKNHQVILEVRSSLNDNKGTIIEEEAPVENQLVVRGLAFESNVTKITLFGLPNRMDTLSNVFSTLASSGVNVDIIIQNVNDKDVTSLSFSIDTIVLDETMDILQRHQKNLSYERVDYENGLAKVSIVGSGMISNPGVAAQMFHALTEQKVMIKMVSTSEIKVSTVISQNDLETALSALHETFRLGEKQMVTQATT